MTSTMTQINTKSLTVIMTAFLTPSLQVGVINNNQSEGGIRFSLFLSLYLSLSFSSSLSLSLSLSLSIFSISLTLNVKADS